MKPWKDLSMKERGAFIKVGVKNGITSVDGIRDAYNKFACGGHKLDDGGTKLSNGEFNSILRRQAEVNAKMWGMSPAEAYWHMLGDPTYDYRGFYEANPNDQSNPETHWPDTYKTYLHPTFSNESKYSGKIVFPYNPTGAVGGRWEGDEYIPNDEYHRRSWEEEKARMNQRAKGGRLSHKFDGTSEPTQWMFRNKNNPNDLISEAQYAELFGAGDERFKDYEGVRIAMPKQMAMPKQQQEADHLYKDGRLDEITVRPDIAYNSDVRNIPALETTEEPISDEWRKRFARTNAQLRRQAQMTPAEQWANYYEALENLSPEDKRDLMRDRQFANYVQGMAMGTLLGVPTSFTSPIFATMGAADLIYNKNKKWWNYALDIPAVAAPFVHLGMSTPWGQQLAGSVSGRSVAGYNKIRNGISESLPYLENPQKSAKLAYKFLQHPDVVRKGYKVYNGDINVGDFNKFMSKNHDFLEDYFKPRSEIKYGDLEKYVESLSEDRKEVLLKNIPLIQSMAKQNGLDVLPDYLAKQVNTAPIEFRYFPYDEKGNILENAFIPSSESIRIVPKRMGNVKTKIGRTALHENEHALRYEVKKQIKAQYIDAIERLLEHYEKNPNSGDEKAINNLLSALRDFSHAEHFPQEISILDEAYPPVSDDILHDDYTVTYLTPDDYRRNGLLYYQKDKTTSSPIAPFEQGAVNTEIKDIYRKLGEDVFKAKKPEDLSDLIKVRWNGNKYELEEPFTAQGDWYTRVYRDNIKANLDSYVSFYRPKNTSELKKVVNTFIKIQNYAIKKAVMYVGGTTGGAYMLNQASEGQNNNQYGLGGYINSYGLGGHIYDGTTEDTQQMNAQQTQTDWYPEDLPEWGRHLYDSYEQPAVVWGSGIPYVKYEGNENEPGELWKSGTTGILPEVTVTPDNNRIAVRPEMYPYIALSPYSPSDVVWDIINNDHSHKSIFVPDDEQRYMLYDHGKASNSTYTYSLLNAIAEEYSKAGVPLIYMLGHPYQETTWGNDIRKQTYNPFFQRHSIYDKNDDKGGYEYRIDGIFTNHDASAYDKLNAASGWNLTYDNNSNKWYLANYGIDNEKALSDLLQQEYEKGELYNSPIYNIAKYFSTGNYNSGDPYYYNKVEDRGRDMLSQKAVQEWLKIQPYYSSDPKVIEREFQEYNRNVLGKNKNKKK